jgi:feruloyl-CoA synthase
MNVAQQAALQQPPEKPPFRPISYATPAIGSKVADDGVVRLHSLAPLAPHDPSLAGLFRTAAELAPARIFLAERDGTQWRKLRYGEARRAVDAIAQALIDRGLSAERPAMILSGNAIDHALLTLAGHTAGIPVAPISVAYSLQSQDHAKLRHIADLLAPGLIYVFDTAPFAKALAALDAADAEIVASRNGANLADVTAFDDLARTTPGAAVERAVASIGAGTIAKFLFTSGSTSLPKGVINTHGMLTSNQQALAQVWPFLADDPLVLVDWLPWNHTFGGNNNFNLVLRHAGTLYIDAGKPMPALVVETVRNLAEVSPTLYYNVPAGYAALLPHLEGDEALARSFFARLRLIFYAGAALPQDLWERLEALSIRVTGRRVPMTSAWGSTETAPMATIAHFLIERAGVIGVPVPGTELKLIPNGSKIEVRVRGANVTPGYWKRPDLTAEAFDEEGFYRIGDTVRFSDPADPTKGIVFDGRLAEDFKLMTGTWVHVGALRVGLLAAATPALQDAVVAGENRAFVGLLAWLSAAGCHKLIGPGAPTALDGLARHPTVRDHVRTAIARWNAAENSSSQRVERVLLLPDMPSIDGNEITDKGYINQRLALDRRQADVERLFAPDPDPDVIVIDRGR